MQKLKKTEFVMVVVQSYGLGVNICRRVWVDDNGNYFVKYNGEIRNVNHAQAGFFKG